MFQLPLIVPDSPWQRPAALPDLRGRPWVAIDTETRDDSLAAERGPGWPYRAGHVTGISWCAGLPEDADHVAGYAPVRHPDTDNFTPEQVGAWLRDLVASGTRLFFQNGPYDLGWAWAEWGVQLPLGYPMDDALAMSFMDNENHLTYNLDDICRREGLPGKDEALLREAAAVYLDPGLAARGQRAKKFTLTNKLLKSNLWRLPARYVGGYATIDTVATARAILKLWPRLRAQNLEEAYRLEMNLVPVVQRMRARGIRVNVDAAQRDVQAFRGRRDALLAEIGRRLPGRAQSVSMENLRTNRWLEPTFQALGIKYPRTAGTGAHPDGQASFTKDWMARDAHWLPPMIVKAEQYDGMSEKFLGEFLLGFAHRGRIHSEVHQYKSDDGGTVSYRLSMSQPPLQQAPSPDIDAECGLAFRDKFQADEGEIWYARDYSQQEYRLTAHFAALCEVLGGEEAVAAYRRDPSLDYHKFVADLSGLPRSKAKIQNFAILYGEGLAATALKLNVSREDADALRKDIAVKAPFGPALSDYTRSAAQSSGYIKLIDGARCRFDEWEAGWLTREERARGHRERWPMNPCSRAEAEARRKIENHPWRGVRLKRAHLHKAMNRLVQGSAARMTKRAMWECALAGAVPLLQVHDELNFSLGDPALAARTVEIMRDVLPLRVPMKVDAGSGATWAAAKSKG